MARGLFIEPFNGGSHRAFLDGLVRHSEHQIELLTLPEGEWRRRMRRGAQELAPKAKGLQGDFEFLVVSDMLDLPAFLALTRPRFERLPVLAYFHENQMTYPRLRGTKFNSWFGQINYLTALAADAVAFNSEYHRSDFLGALRALLSEPNNWLLAEGVDEVERKSFVLPVGVELDWIGELECERVATGPRTILWNHRWEFDKSPELFVRALDALVAQGIEFHLIIVGEPGDNPSEAITSLPARFPGRLKHFGFAPAKEDYGQLLWQSDIVVSTARHEFFGIGMVEAMATGCIPCAPRRYNYPALVPAPLHELLLWENEPDFVGKLARLLTADLPGRAALRDSAVRFAWPNVIAEWDHVLSALSRSDFATKPSIPSV